MTGELRCLTFAPDHLPVGDMVAQDRDIDDLVLILTLTYFKSITGGALVPVTGKSLTFDITVI